MGGQVHWDWPRNVGGRSCGRQGAGCGRNVPSRLEDREILVPGLRSRSEREHEGFATDTRPGADAFVYCKGCGKQLESRARLSKPRAVVDAMMCEPCQEKHGHTLMPLPGSPTFCYRCGRPEEVFIEPSTTPITHHICPHCLPERSTRYRAGDFAEPQRTPADVQA